VTAASSGASFSFGERDEYALRLVSDERALTAQRLARRCNGCGLPLLSFPSRASFLTHEVVCAVTETTDGSDDEHQLGVAMEASPRSRSSPWKRPRLTH
jgi:hypothetical protein